MLCCLPDMVCGVAEGSRQLEGPWGRGECPRVRPRVSVLPPRPWL